MTAGTPDSEESGRVQFNDLLSVLSGSSPGLSKLLQSADDRRAWTLTHVLANPFGARALEELIVYADGIVWISDRAGSPVKQLARRVRNDIEDGIDGMLQVRQALVLSACRDLMEVTVLARDLRTDKQRLTKWLKSDENVRRTEFGFGHEVRMRPDPDGIPYMGNVDDALIEYTLHSRSLHPAPSTTSDEELSHDTFEDAEGETWVESFVYEISRHGLAALWQLVQWIIKDFSGAFPDDDEPDQPSDFFPADDGPLASFEEHHRTNWVADSGWIASQMEKYRTRPKP